RTTSSAASWSAPSGIMRHPQTTAHAPLFRGVCGRICEEHGASSLLQGHSSERRLGCVPFVGAPVYTTIAADVARRRQKKGGTRAAQYNQPLLRNVDARACPFRRALCGGDSSRRARVASADRRIAAID